MAHPSVEGIDGDAEGHKCLPIFITWSVVDRIEAIRAADLAYLLVGRVIDLEGRAPKNNKYVSR
jgi:hypothetical protein